MSDPTNGGVSFDSIAADGIGNYAFGTVATFTCDSSFGLNGAETRTCGGDGSSPTGVFDGTSPTCERESWIKFSIYMVLIGHPFWPTHC